MKSDLDYLPERKQRELRRIVETLHDAFAEKTRSATSKRRRAGKILKIILFGSYARGDWVEDRKGGYFSDYDLLIAVDHDDFTDMAAYWSVAEDRILRDRTIKTVPQLIVHTLHDVNDALKEGRYFFTDIIRDGVMLYELKDARPSGNGKYRLATPTLLDPQAAYDMANGYFDRCIGTARSSLNMYHQGIAIQEWKQAAFLLHQATEHSYAAFFLTLTLYVPKDHNIRFLRSRAEDMEPDLREAWPRGRKPYDKRFELLRRAYVEARYSEHYEISNEDLDWLEGCVTRLMALVENACQAHLATLKSRTQQGV